MKNILQSTIVHTFFCFVLAAEPELGFVQMETDFGQVEKILGQKGQMDEGAFVVRFPRSDIAVTLDGESIPTPFGFGSWTAWIPNGNEVMVMGDLVLLEKEVNPVISSLAGANINVTALHNHFLGEQPRIMYMHIHGMGNRETLARGIRNALDETASPKPATSISPPVLVSLDTKHLEEIIGHPGNKSGSVFKITIGRAGVKTHGIELTSSMGMNSWAAFIGTDEKVHVAGDIVMTAPEVNRVIRALRNGNIEIVAVHNHMLDEEPRVFFLHYWGTGPAEKLARTVHSAFDEVKNPVH